MDPQFCEDCAPAKMHYLALTTEQLAAMADFFNDGLMDSGIHDAIAKKLLIMAANEGLLDKELES